MANLKVTGALAIYGDGTLAGDNIATIVEYGDGYVRFGNGTQILNGQKSIGRDTNTTISFPKPFITTDYSIAVLMGACSEWSGYINGFKIDNKTNSNVTIALRGVGNTFDWIAVGRWK